MAFGNLEDWLIRWHLSHVQSFKTTLLKNDHHLFISLSLSLLDLLESLFEPTYGAQIGQLEVSVVHFEDVSTRRSFDVDSETHSLLKSRTLFHKKKKKRKTSNQSSLSLN